MKPSLKRTRRSFTALTLTLPFFATMLSGSLPSVFAAPLRVPAPTDDFVITVKTNNYGPSSDTQFTIPTTGVGYNYNVDCNNDGANEATAQTDDYTCNYASADTYTIMIKDNSGDGTGFPRIYFNNGGDKGKLLTIEQWGTGKWTSMVKAFQGCIYLAGGASDAPDLSNVTNMSYMFAGATRFNQDIGSWDVGALTDALGMFDNVTLSQPTMMPCLMAGMPKHFKMGWCFLAATAPIVKGKQPETIWSVQIAGRLPMAERTVPRMMIS